MINKDIKASCPLTNYGILNANTTDKFGIDDSSLYTVVGLKYMCIFDKPKELP